jgi:hypothetical protein
MLVLPSKGTAIGAAAGATPPKKSALFTDETSVAELRVFGFSISAILFSFSIWGWYVEAFDD